MTAVLPELVIVVDEGHGPFEEGGAQKVKARMSFSANPSGGYPTGGLDFSEALAPWGIGRIEQIEDASVMNDVSLAVPVVAEWSSSSQNMLLYRQQNLSEVTSGANLQDWLIEATFVGPRKGGIT